MSELLVTATIAGEQVALRTAAVEAVITVDRLTPVPLAPVHVAGLCALRSRILTAIDCRAALELPADPAPRADRTAIVVEHQGHSYALLVDSVEEVTELLWESASVPQRAGEGWQRVAFGVVGTPRGMMLGMDPARLIDGPATSRAAA